MRSRYALAGLLAAAGLASAIALGTSTQPASAPFESLVGRHVTVHFRGVHASPEQRSAASGTGSVTTVNNVAIGAQGFLREVRAGWIRLADEDNAGECWVPIDEIRALHTSVSIAEMIRIREAVENRSGR